MQDHVPRIELKRLHLLTILPLGHGLRLPSMLACVQLSLFRLVMVEFSGRPWCNGCMAAALGLLLASFRLSSVWWIGWSFRKCKQGLQRQTRYPRQKNY